MKHVVVVAGGIHDWGGAVEAPRVGVRPHLHQLQCRLRAGGGESISRMNKQTAWIARTKHIAWNVSQGLLWLLMLADARASRGTLLLLFNARGSRLASRYEKCKTCGVLCP